MRYSIYKKLVLQDERSSKLIFEPDGRIFYVYRITNIESKEYYYGSRNSDSENLLEDLIKYSSSSKRKNDIKNNKEKYKFKILKVFDNTADKIIYESFLHAKFNVKKHNQFFNESNQTPFGFDTTGMKPWNKGKTNLGGYTLKNKRSAWSKEHKEKLSKSMKGHKKSSIENYSNISKNKVVVKDEKGNNIKINKEDWDKQKYKSISEGSLTATDIRTNIKTRVSKDEFNRNKFLIANGSKWFYEVNGNVYRNSDLPKLMESLDISCSIQTYKKQINKINLSSYSSLLI